MSRRKGGERCRRWQRGHLSREAAGGRGSGWKRSRAGCVLVRASVVHRGVPCGAGGVIGGPGDGVCPAPICTRARGRGVLPGGPSSWYVPSPTGDSPTDLDGGWLAGQRMPAVRRASCCACGRRGHSERAPARARSLVMTTTGRDQRRAGHHRRRSSPAPATTVSAAGSGISAATRVEHITSRSWTWTASIRRQRARNGPVLEVLYDADQPRVPRLAGAFIWIL
ncbi:hypothetical protein BC628DRAFT_1391433 [Trametes gibbosa]|nr:hypothetical protein BC628DRAFT_1391433 [Trametes gibbosa]